MEQFRWLAGVIAAHENREVVGRTRLQKEIKLLQRLNLPTRYQYPIHFYGPYSEGLQAEIGLLDMLGLVSETQHSSGDGTTYFKIRATAEAEIDEISDFKDAIHELEKAEAVVLELAATYDAFRELGSDHKEAVRRLKRKKGTKCDGGNEQHAMQLLESLGLPTEEPSDLNE